MSLAYHIAVLTRMDPQKFPELKTLQIGQREQKQSMAEQRTQLEAIAAMLGKKLKPVKKGKKGKR